MIIKHSAQSYWEEERKVTDIADHSTVKKESAWFMWVSLTEGSTAFDNAQYELFKTW